jgi:hypothetical protein
MGREEVATFLEQERTVVCATLGPSGWPHLMPLWYTLRERSGGRPGPQLWSWTYATSQKVRNLARDPRATLEVQAGELYHELRGVMLECEVAIHRDLEIVKALGEEIFARYTSPPGVAPAEKLPTELVAMLDSQARKRVALQFIELDRVTWDHRKLDGVY